jgi:hypothetical protein
VDNNLWIIIDLDQPVRDGSGNDLSVYRASGTGTASVQGANGWNGPWTTLGTANAARTDFDLGSVGLDSARYIRVKASGQFLLDAIEGNILTGIGTSRESPAVSREPLVLSVMPNPVRSSATLRIRQSGNPQSALHLRLYDVNGQCRRRITVPVGRTDVSLEVRNADGSALADGIYFVRTDDDGSAITKFVVER